MSISDDIPVDPAVDPDIAPPDFNEGRIIVGDPIVEEEEPEEETTVLTDEERADLHKLLTVGRRHKKVVILDHTVQLQTIKSADEMRMGLATKPYLESHGFARAHKTALCAAAVIEIDGSPVYRSMVPIDDDEHYRKTFEKLQEYYPLAIDLIYDEAMKLEREFGDLLVKLGKLKG